MKQANAVSDATELESGNVFRIRSAHDVFAKVYREKRRFEKAGSDNEGRKDQVDAAVNFAITAWHMTDWVWQRQQHELCEHFGVRCLREFQDEMRRRCPDLAVCDVIANAAKHGGAAHKKPDRPEIETVLVAQPVADGTAGVELYVVEADPEWSLMIRVNGKPEDPGPLFNRIYLFWWKFIQQYCVAKESLQSGALVEK
jgi:hypothetical protein